MYLIYKYTSPSGKSYIGQTKNLSNRIAHHKYLKTTCTVFSKAIQKYGWDNFIQEILAEHLSLEEANILEPKLILEHNTLVPNGYNLQSGGLNYIHSSVSIVKMSLAKKGKPLSDQHKQKLSECSARRGLPARNKGIPHSEETKQKQSIAHKGNVPTIETRQKLSIARKKYPSPVKGRKWKVNPETGKREYYFPDSNS